MRRLLVAMAVCLMPIALYATESADGKAKPSAKSELKKVVKAFSKEKNYHVELQVAGGFSNTPDHKITDQKVSQQYKGDYYRGLMKLPEPQIIRTHKKGAIRQAGNWYQILAHADGTMVERLFHFPDVVLKDAIAKGAEVSWEGAKTKKVIDGDGITGVAKEVTVAPNKLIVELPQKIALKRYTTIQTSGATSDC